MANSQLLDIFLIAMVACIILFRLYSVLGRRTGHERPPQKNFRLPGSPTPIEGAIEGKFVALPGPADDKPASERPADSLADPLARGLLDIGRADRSFDSDHFIAAARGSYEIISAAYEAGDRAVLRPLVSDEVYAAFDAVIDERGARPEKTAYMFSQFKQAKIIHASLADNIAEITVSFSVQFRSATEPDAMHDVTDVWTFSRDVRVRDPRWTLVATSGDLT